MGVESWRRGMLDVVLAVSLVLCDAGSVAVVESSAAGQVDGATLGTGRRTVVAYSLHGTLRCQTCLLVEQGAEEAIRQGFASELHDGSLVRRSINIRLPGNERYSKEFEVSSWALVIAEYTGDGKVEWRKSALAGELVRGNPEVFRRYVNAEVRASLNDARMTTGGEE